MLFNLSSTSSRVNASIASLQRSIVTISDRHIASKLKNQISAELSDKDEALKVLNSHRNNILRVLSTSANIPEMMEELICVSSSAACSTRLELCCASLRKESLQEIAARFAELQHSIDEEVSLSGADIVETVERNVGSHLDAVIFEHESVGKVECSNGMWDDCAVLLQRTSDKDH